MSILEWRDLCAVKPHATLPGISKDEQEDEDDADSSPADCFCCRECDEDGEDGDENSHCECTVQKNAAAADALDGKVEWYAAEGEEDV